MAENTINTRESFEINGLTVNPPVEWADIEIEASFDNDNIQPNITIDTFRFVNKEATILKDWINNGFPGIFEGIPFKIKGFNNTNNLSVFDGFINLSDDVSLLEDGSVNAKVIKKDGLNNLQDRLDALTFGFLEDIGIINSSNYTTIDYVVEKKINAVELIISNVVLFLMIKELAESIERVATDIATGIALTSIPLGGAIGAVVWFAAKALINLAYAIVLLAAVINLANKLFQLLLPPVRQHKVMKLRTAMERVCIALGYNFVSPITELDDVYFLPSNPRQDNVSLLDGLITTYKGTQSGIPNQIDFGYGCGEFFQVMRELFNGKYAIVGNDLHLRSLNDPYWVKTSTYQLPDVLIEEQKYNTNELNARWSLDFKIDLRDDWTIDNYVGSSLERVTDAITVNNLKAKYLKGIEEIQIPYALGNRKDQLNAVENTLKVVAGLIDSVTGAFGSGTNFVSTMNNKVGMLKVSDNSHSIPKLLFLKGGKIPVNDRVSFSAPKMYQKYWNESSWVTNANKRQRKVYNNVRIPFGLNDFVKLIDNNYITDSNGNLGRVLNISWNLFSDYATITYYTEFKYAPNLKETFIIAQ